MRKSVITLVSVLALGGLLAGCGNQHSAANKNSSSAVKSSQVVNHKQKSIVGSFKDNKDGAAITLNSDGTGQYVYADSDNPDTNDQLTWKKDGANYTVTLKDSNVSGPLTAKLSGNQLTLSGSGDWNTETFTKAKDKLDLNQFLSEAHKAQKNNGDVSNNDQNNGNQLTFDDAANLIQKGNFKDFDYDEAKSFHDGSHATSNGGYLMITYPGAKGEDRFTITKKSNNKYHIEAQYGTAEGGFHLLGNQNSYGPTSADVTK